jgi:hypothetical protein
MLSTQPASIRGEHTDASYALTVLRFFLFSCALIVLAVAVAGCASTSGSRKSQAAVVPPPPPLQIVSVRLTAAGHYLDLRYRVTDGPRAAELMQPKVRMYLVDEATGATMTVPETAKLGALRQLARHPETGRTYFVMFDNRIGVGSGRSVKAVIGEYEFPGLKVE